MEIKKNNTNVSKEIDCDFSFVLTVNNANGEEFIVSKRDFNIYNFKEESLISYDLKNTIDDIVVLIDRDLKSKSRTYTWYMSGYRWKSNLKPLYDDAYETPEFSQPLSEESGINLKFSFLYKDKVIITKIWDADVYPSLIRNNIDLSNKKDFEDNEILSSYNKMLLKKASAGRPDLNSIIIQLLATTCSTKLSDNKIHKLYLSDLKLDNMSLNKNDKPERPNYRVKSVSTEEKTFNNNYYEVFESFTSVI